MAKSKNTKIYYEPENYFPKELLKEFELGAYNKEAQAEAKKLEEKQRAKDNKQLRSVFKGK